MYTTALCFLFSVLLLFSYIPTVQISNLSVPCKCALTCHYSDSKTTCIMFYFYEVNIFLSIVNIFAHKADFNFYLMTQMTYYLEFEQLEFKGALGKSKIDVELVNMSLRSSIYCVYTCICNRHYIELLA